MATRRRTAHTPAISQSAAKRPSAKSAPGEPIIGGEPRTAGSRTGADEPSIRPIDSAGVFQSSGVGAPEASADIAAPPRRRRQFGHRGEDRKSTRLNYSH